MGNCDSGPGGNKLEWQGGLFYIYIYIFTKPERRQNCIFFFLTHSFSCYLFFFQECYSFSVHCNSDYNKQRKNSDIMKIFYYDIFCSHKTKQETGNFIFTGNINFPNLKSFRAFAPYLCGPLLCRTQFGCSSEHVSKTFKVLPGCSCPPPEAFIQNVFV